VSKYNVEVAILCEYFSLLSLASRIGSIVMNTPTHISTIGSPTLTSSFVVPVSLG
jgi:hypothetical protein